jgi:hypothetical protein
LQQLICGCVELVGGADTFTIDRLLKIFRVFGMSACGIIACEGLASGNG